ncbi:hypothetical protein [Xanthomonas bundabergensis]|uniref:hypothetical protein n=1 Tax=Xanthomonas bundabergensis TaxID=3160842 RepID=UPI0035166562
MPWTKTLTAVPEDQRIQSFAIPPNGCVSANDFRNCVNESEIDYALAQLRLFDTPGTQPDPQLLTSFDSSVRINVVGHAGSGGFSKSKPRELAARIQQLLQPWLHTQSKRIQPLHIALYLYGCSIGQELDARAPLKPDTYLHTLWTELNLHGVYVHRISAPRGFEWTDSDARSVVSLDGGHGTPDPDLVRSYYQTLAKHWIEAVCRSWISRGQRALLYAPAQLVAALQAAADQLDDSIAEGENEGEAVIHDPVLQPFLVALQHWYACVRGVANGADPTLVPDATDHLLKRLADMAQIDATNAWSHWMELGKPLADLLLQANRRATEALFQTIAGYSRLYALRCCEDTGRRLRDNARAYEATISEADTSLLYLGDLSGRRGISAASPQWVGFDTSFDALVERALYEISDDPANTRGPNLGALLNMGSASGKGNPVSAMFMDWWIKKGYAKWIYVSGSGKVLSDWSGSDAAKSLETHLKKRYGFVDHGYELRPFR